MKENNYKIPDSREAILSLLRRNSDYSKAAQERVSSKMAKPFTPIVEAVGCDKDKKAMIAQMKAKLAKNSAICAHCEKLEQISDVIFNFLQKNNLPNHLSIGDNPFLSKILSAEQIEIKKGAATAQDSTSVSIASAAISEVAALILLSSPQNPVLLAFLPENHIIIIETENIFCNYEQAMQMVMQSKSSMSRTVNFITGPSRSADIEQTLLLGAHGPKKLLVIFCEQQLS